MPSTLTRVAQVYKSGSSDLALPPAGWVGTKPGLKGDLCVINTSGQVDQACADAATIATPAVNKTIAILNEPRLVGDAAGTLTFIEKLDDDTLLELPVATSSGATLGAPIAITTPATTALTLIGSQFQISRSTNTATANDGIYYVNQALTSNPHCEVVGLGTRYPASASFATVLVRILPGARLN